MANTRTPRLAYNKTERFPFVGSPTDRDGSIGNYDQQFINMYPESIKSTASEKTVKYLVKRPGLKTHWSHTAAEGRGLFVWNSNVYYVIADKFYKNGTALSLTLTTTTGKVGFTLCQTETEVYLVLVDGVKGYVIRSDDSITPIIPNAWVASTAYALEARVYVSDSLWAECTTAGTSGSTAPTWGTVTGNTVTDGTVTWTMVDGAFPTPHIPSPVFFDGYIFLAKEGTSDIYNSYVADATLWAASDFITAEMYPDVVVSIGRWLNQIVAFGHNSTEFFYDAANATGSPLARTDSASLMVGTTSVNAVAFSEKYVFMAGTSAAGGKAIWGIDAYKPYKLSSEPVERSMEAAQSGMELNTVRIAGHMFLVCTIPDANETWVYDIEEKEWHNWTSGTALTMFQGKYAYGDDYYPYWLDRSNGKVYSQQADTYQDDGNDIDCRADSIKIDFGSMNQKTINHVTIVCDIPRTTSSCSLSWSDDDYFTYSTDRVIPLVTNARPITRQCGRFRRRSFRLKYIANAPWRLEGLEIDVNIGIA